MKHQLLYRRFGENVTTRPDPVGVVLSILGSLVSYRDAHDGSTRDADLAKEEWFCASFDNDYPVKAEVYTVGEVDLPDWLTPDEWIRNQTEWKWLWGFGVDREWPEAWQRGLMEIHGAQRVAVVKLLKTKMFRSTFRKSLRDQIVAWLEASRDQRRYGSPLSDRQWQALVTQYDRIEAKRTDSSIYYNR